MAGGRSKLGWCGVALSVPLVTKFEQKLKGELSIPMAFQALDGKKNEVSLAFRVGEDEKAQIHGLLTRNFEVEVASRILSIE